MSTSLTLAAAQILLVIAAVLAIRLIVCGIAELF